MRKVGLLFVFIFVVLQLISCSSLQRKFTYIPPEDNKSCVVRCQVGKNSCEQLCLLKNPTCTANVKQRALAAYKIYKQQQLTKGLKIKKQVKDFEQVNDCNGACHCTVAFNTCYSACGGRVI